MRLVDAAELGRRLSMRAAVDALEAAFAAGVPETPLRGQVPTPDGRLYLMPAAAALGAGVKLISLTPANPGRGFPFIQGVYVLFSPGDQRPEAVIEGGALTALRTGAVSALATRWMANEDAHRLVVFGAGVQARSHVTGMRAVRPIDDVVVVSRTRPPAETLAGEVGGRVGAPEDVRDADIVCTCTTSAEPLFDGSWLTVGTHLNAVGAYAPDARELDTVAVSRARVVVETREGCPRGGGGSTDPAR